MKWIFFDLGSTLINEEECIKYRVEETLKQTGAPSKEEFYRQMEYFASVNMLSYKDTVKKFGLENVKWPKQLEKLYPQSQEVLQSLHGRYKLGIIANQSAGTEKRLVQFGIRDYFDVVVSSAEAGFAKPDKRIFELALSQADCSVREACMVGDRLDNDIVPAAEMGMSTVWVRQGWFGMGNADLARFRPNFIVDSIFDVLRIF
ncbi:MAG: HAD family hydrolase [Oscillospiraceae bacterium]|nr:HAD family hydrolase [Oscillospiraceae bacterium]